MRPKSKSAALILCIFFGIFGVHRFYVRKIWTGLLWLFTGGLFGFGVLIDFILICTNNFKDKLNRNLMQDVSVLTIAVIIVGIILYAILNLVFNIFGMLIGLLL